MADENTNFKGVMMCNRPGEPLTYAVERPFISRVDPKEPIGLNPVNKTMIAFRKKSCNFIFILERNAALDNHKRWLEEYKEQMRMKKAAEQVGNGKDSSYYDRIKESAARDRERTRQMKEEYENMKSLIDNTIQIENQPESHPKPLTKENLANLENPQEEQYHQNPNPNPNPNLNNNKKQIPKWAFTEGKAEEKEEQECDNLLDFMNTFDYENYIEDYEVKSMVSALKDRIKQIKKGNSQIQSKPKGNPIQNPTKNLEDNHSTFSANSLGDSKSVASERSQASIQKIQSKLQKPADWDATSNSKGNKQSVDMETQIVKHVADEVLRNHSDLNKVHSNASIRKILETEARKFFEENKHKPLGPTIAKANEKGEKEFEASNLPYLHRNPAI